jgi:glycerol-1-phosphate dehydrogenase [NAD(P)+]
MALGKIAIIDEIVLPADLVASEKSIAEISQRTRSSDALVAVGSGTINDCCKHATFLDGRPYAVFGSAASMNGYASSTASLKLDSGLKVSVPSNAPRGIFLDLKVAAEAPSRLRAAGLGDSLCRPTAQIDWWTAHRLTGSHFSATPYALTDPEEPAMIATASGLKSGDLTATGILQRVLTLCAMGVCFTGVSNHGSMGEHMVSHWIDMFAGDRHPGSLHGEQVGIAAIAIMKLQRLILSSDMPPIVRPTQVDEADMLERYGPAAGPQIVAEFRSKALDQIGADNLNSRLASIWPDLKSELQPKMLDPETMIGALDAAGGATTGSALGLAPDLWRDALIHAREIRSRWTFLDLAADSGLLDDFVADLA